MIMLYTFKSLTLILDLKMFQKTFCKLWMEKTLLYGMIPW
jgi:hypothetical protein